MLLEQVNGGAHDRVTTRLILSSPPSLQDDNLEALFRELMRRRDPCRAPSYHGYSVVCLQHHGSFDGPTEP